MSDVTRPPGLRSGMALTIVASVAGLVVLGGVLLAYGGWGWGAPLASQAAAGPSGAATASPSASLPKSATPTATPAVEFPLAAVTSLANLQPGVTYDEVIASIDAGTILVPCGLEALGDRSDPQPPPGSCLEAPAIVESVMTDPAQIALLPPGLVAPPLKVLPVDGADLFGSREARSREYPIWGSSLDMPDEWTAYDADEVRTLVSTGESCADRGVAFAAITEGRGWPWVVNGGTAAYTRIYPNPVGPGQVGDGYNIFDAVRTGGEGAVKRILQSADLTVSGYECPVHADWTIAQGTVFGTDPAIPPLLAEIGVDVVTLGANHITDQGTSALAETLQHFDAAGIARTGAGMTIDEALEPAVVEVLGMRWGFVGMNVIPGALEAAAGQPGAAYITESNAAEAVRRARAGGAAVVFCLPEWGWPEYHADMSDDQRRLQALLFDAGCDHILGRGTHWVGELDFRRGPAGGTQLTVGSHGNFIFGQDWSQETAEGVLVELAFSGSRLAQARLHPYAILDQAQPNLLDPQADGRFALERIFAVTDFAVD